MNNSRIFLICALLIFLCSFAYAQNGVILELSGEVELKHSGSANFVTANLGDEVRSDTVISTGFRSGALVEVGSALFTIRPLTRLTLTEVTVTADSETINANLQAGRVRVEVNSPAGLRTSMSVSSPSATASVRGTTIEFDGKILSTSEGTGVLQGNNGLPVLVGENFAAGITGNGSAGNAFYTGPGTAASDGGTGQEGSAEGESDAESIAESGTEGIAESGTESIGTEGIADSTIGSTTGSTTGSIAEGGTVIGGGGVVVVLPGGGGGGGGGNNADILPQTPPGSDGSSGVSGITSTPTPPPSLPPVTPPPGPGPAPSPPPSGGGGGGYAPPGGNTGDTGVNIGIDWGQ